MYRDIKFIADILVLSSPELKKFGVMSVNYLPVVCAAPYAQNRGPIVFEFRILALSQD